MAIADEAQDAPEIWPYAALRLVADETRGGPLRLAFGERRLSVDDPAFAAALLAASPRLRRQRRRGLEVAMLAALAALLAGVALWWTLPRLIDAVIGSIPPSWEARLGREAMDALAPRLCTAELGRRALGQLVRRLGAGTAIPHRFSVVVAANEIPNAFALPDGHIVIMRGLLEKMRSPDELAGVLAHEMTHVLRRDPLRVLVTGTGASLVFKVLFGGGGGSALGSTVFALSYSRGAEADADAGAIDLLRAAGIGTTGLADLLERLGRGSGPGLPAFLLSHPATQQRVAALRAAASDDARPALTETDWQAVMWICDRTAIRMPIR